jgi:hypothetical protein
MITAQELNEIHKAFWLIETAEAENRMRSKEVAEIATNLIKFEGDRRVPLAWRKTFECALAEAGTLNGLLTPHIVRQAASRAGSAHRIPDELRLFILHALRSKPELTRNDLLHALKKAGRSGGPSLDADGEHVTFMTARGKPKTVSINVLKDRLSRVKKQMRSEN